MSSSASEPLWVVLLVSELDPSYPTIDSFLGGYQTLDSAKVAVAELRELMDAQLAAANAVAAHPLAGYVLSANGANFGELTIAEVPRG